MRHFFIFLFLAGALIFAITSGVNAQTNSAGEGILPEVIKVDDVSVMPLLKPNGKPLLVNFWATWCVPCVEEFPLLVKLDQEYKGRIDFITISVDDLAEIKRDVPKFLKEQNATMPAYLLWTRDENAVISSISKDLGGGLPLTVFYDSDGALLYAKQGLVKMEVLKPIIDTSLIVEDCGQDLKDN